jgi:tetratricopeptide (TPR) repeat protein
MFLVVEFAAPMAAAAQTQVTVQAQKLFKLGQDLSDKTHYLEALDVLDEARDIIEASGMTDTSMYGDVLFALAQTKIKGRIHQDFSAYYVKTALVDIQAANKLREKLPGMLPQKLAEGYYLEGYIHKRFFMRNKLAKACLEKAVNIDPGAVAPKRELYDLLPAENHK